MVYWFPFCPVIENCSAADSVRVCSHPHAGHIFRYKFSFVSYSAGFCRIKYGRDISCLLVTRRNPIIQSSGQSRGSKTWSAPPGRMVPVLKRTLATFTMLRIVPDGTCSFASYIFVLNHAGSSAKRSFASMIDSANSVDTKLPPSLAPRKSEVDS